MTRYHPDQGLVEFILGITFEIWECGRVERINDYYAADTQVFALSGLIHGAGGMIAGTRRMLEAFPDRLLLADDVIWSGSPAEGFYSSHRVLSPMTNTGPSAYGPPTGKRVRTLTIADCIVEGGRITREYLLRDHYSLVRQLGVDPRRAAEQMASERGAGTERWIEGEIARLSCGSGTAKGLPLPSPQADPSGFARQVIDSHLGANSDAVSNAAYASYAVMYRSPDELYSGRDSIKEHFAQLRQAISGCNVSIDHVACQPVDRDGLRIAVRWCAAGAHTGDYLGIPATGQSVFVLGSTHWRIVGEHIAMEWTVFDQLGVMAQLVSRP
ncbi:MAG: ester cyclase [Proteobacteria bacterium]|nr:ester cyclase [Pseudomonadota bacterium]MYJ95052.1 ester cyclase [Pseudomonadota bacterium]